MYNKNIPAQNELPSTKQLITSTFIAAIVATTILVTAILPAEYAIDPTGVGRALGLVEMAEIKSSLAEEQQAEQQKIAQQSVQVAEQEKADVQPVSTPEIEALTQPLIQTDTKVLVLKPGQAAEIKVVMKKGAVVQYLWTTQGGKLNFDTHGDNKDISYHGYGKGRNVASDKGDLEAAFDGSHGWFWRNRSKLNVEVTLMTKGQYSKIKRVL